MNPARVSFINRFRKNATAVMAVVNTSADLVSEYNQLGYGDPVKGLTAADFVAAPGSDNSDIGPEEIASAIAVMSIQEAGLAANNNAGSTAILKVKR